MMFANMCVCAIAIDWSTENTTRRILGQTARSKFITRRLKMVPLFIDFKDDFNQLFATWRSGVVVFPDHVVKPVPALLIFYTVSNVSVMLHLAVCMHSLPSRISDCVLWSLFITRWQWKSITFLSNECFFFFYFFYSYFMFLTSNFCFALFMEKRTRAVS